ncbi:hypothetical protein D9M72_475410 [compost metagenome]
MCRRQRVDRFRHVVQLVESPAHDLDEAVARLLVADAQHTGNGHRAHRILARLGHTAYAPGRGVENHIGGAKGHVVEVRKVLAHFDAGGDEDDLSPFIQEHRALNRTQNGGLGDLADRMGSHARQRTSDSEQAVRHGTGGLGNPAAANPVQDSRALGANRIGDFVRRFAREAEAFFAHTLERGAGQLLGADDVLHRLEQLAALVQLVLRRIGPFGQKELEQSFLVAKNGRVDRVGLVGGLLGNEVFPDFVDTAVLRRPLALRRACAGSPAEREGESLDQHILLRR